MKRTSGERAGTAGGAPPPGTGPDTRELLSLGQARDELGLDYDEFDVALQTGEVPCVVCGPGQWKVPADVVARLRSAPDHPAPLLARLRLVSSDGAAGLLGVGRERFVRLARAGHLRPVRWYVNQYRAVVWLYLAREIQEFADRDPALLHGPLPAGLREAVAAGEDERPRGWRARRAAQLVRDAYDAWEEAAVWAALLGPEIVTDAVPDAYERGHLRRLRAELPPGRVGRATAEQIRELTVADDPDEIARGLLALSDALGRARALRPAPRPAPDPFLSREPSPPAERSLEPERFILSERRRALPAQAGVPVPAGLPAQAGVPVPAGLPAQAVPPESAGPRRLTAGSGGRRGLRRLLLGRRSAADLPEEPFLHHGHQQPALAVEDLAAGQAQGAGRDG
ncbi:DUF6397 family protein [Streptomyces sp. NBC_01476]|uniref:DUF6397 family protein n=1 Tax=Streptomyces sp. NBC_01476 TaxID=2903881 RepID=UPI002E2F5FAD|nr:DUF6397 family protein [Streptomyces sp. NBC_01476]